MHPFECTCLSWPFRPPSHSESSGAVVTDLVDMEMLRQTLCKQITPVLLKYFISTQQTYSGYLS